VVKKIKKVSTGNGNGDERPPEPTHIPVKEVEARLLEAGSQEELNVIHKVLRQEGVPDGTITATITNLRKRGELIFQKAVTVYGQDKPSTVEVIMKDMRLPEIANGSREVFDAGVNYGMRALVAGVRLAQELSQMGIAQASPVIRMATEMRKAEGMSAQEAGQRAAEDALAGAIQYLSAQKADIATVPNPMMGIIARAMEPAMTQLFGRIFAPFTGQPQTGGQPQSGSELPAGWVDKGKEAKGEETKR